MDANIKLSRKIYLASQNQHKLEELRALLADLPVEIYLASELKHDITWDETGATFADNARIKARAVKAHTGDCVLADDSGLEVEALAGAPGVHSARYAAQGPGNASDEQNNTKLLAALSDEPNRQARFTCCLCFLDESGAEYFFTGHLDGKIGTSLKGEHGFGYDPLFQLPARQCSLAEVPAAEKNKISHRSAAVDQFRQFLLAGLSRS